MGQTITFGAHEVDPPAAPPGVVFGADGAGAPPAVLPALRSPMVQGGRGTQLDLDQSQRGYALATTPLAHPTGVDAVDSFTSPVGLVSLAAGGVGVVRAGLVDGALAAAKAAAEFTHPFIKFEVAKNTMRAAGIPGWIADPVAYALSGYRRGGGAAQTAEAAVAEVKGGITPPADLNAPHLDTSTPVRPSDLTQQQIAERMFYGRDFGPRAAPVEKPPLGARMRATAPATTGPSQPPPPVLDPEAQAIRDQTAPFSATPGARPASPPDVPAPPADLGTPAPASTSPAVSNWSPQRIRNEVGLAARRAKLSLSDDQLAQADALVRQGQSPPSAVRSVAPAPKLKVTAAEMGLYTNLRQRGLTQAQAMETVAAQRQLAQSLGTPSSEAVRQAVEDRNRTGRWPGEE